MNGNVPQAETRNAEAGDTGRAENRAEGAVAPWAKPDYQVVETAMEVTAYFGAEL